jgi:hypothetical protein
MSKKAEPGDGTIAGQLLLQAMREKIRLLTAIADAAQELTDARGRLDTALANWKAVI